jgi:pyruvate kinase
MANALDHLNAGRTRLEWTAQLNTEYKPDRNYRRTSIICTIGAYLPIVQQAANL